MEFIARSRPKLMTACGLSTTIWVSFGMWRGNDLEPGFLLFLRTGRPAPGSFCMGGSKVQKTRADIRFFGRARRVRAQACDVLAADPAGPGKDGLRFPL